METEAFHFHTELRVRYSEIDGQKIVFNAHYSTYLDIALTEYFRHLFGDDWIGNPEKYKFDPVLVKSIIEYRKPAKLDDRLKVFASVSRIGNTSLTCQFLIKRGEERLIEAETTHVNFDTETEKSVRIPDKVREKITTFEKL